METTASTLPFPELCRRLGKPAAYIKAIMHRLGLYEPAAGAGYAPAYAAFLEAVIALRTFGIGLDEIGELFESEKKLLMVLKIDTLSNSPTWYLDQCDRRREPGRLLLTNFPLGELIGEGAVQSNLDFGARPPELFKAAEMGEDARLVLALYRERCAAIRKRLRAEIPVISAALKWVRSLPAKENASLV